MIIQIASVEDVQKMSPDEYEQYAIQVINTMSLGIVRQLDELASITTVPRATVLASLIEVAMLVIDNDEPKRSDDIKNFVSHFVTRATGQSPNN